MGSDAPSAPEQSIQSTGLAHVAFKIGDSLDALRAMEDWLETHGVKPDRTADHHVSQSIYFHDPDRNQIEVIVDNDPHMWREDRTAVATRLPLPCRSPRASVGRSDAGEARLLAHRQ